MRDFVLNMTGFVLTMTGFVLNVTGFVHGERSLLGQNNQQDGLNLRLYYRYSDVNIQEKVAQTWHTYTF